MALFIEKFPVILIEQLAFNLEPIDLFHFSLVSKPLYEILTDNNIWKSKTIHDFGNLFEIYTIFTTATGIAIDPTLAEKFSQEPNDWRTYYIKKNKRYEHEDTTLADQVDSEYEKALAQLESFQNDADFSKLAQTASKMIWILDVFPTHAGAYYVLGFILFVLNKLEEAIILLKIAHAVDSSFEPSNVLESEIEGIINGYTGYNGEDEPLLIDEQLSARLKEVLVEIFKKFDTDTDGTFSPKELGNYIYKTNGLQPQLAFLKQMGLRFGANEKGYLTQEGFLAFYLEQTLDDPEETKNDLNVHGYDSQTLRQKMEE